MKIHAMSTGTVRLKRAFLNARPGWRRQVNLFLPDEWSGPLPIHCWAIEHNDTLLVVDTGETAAVRNIPFAKFDVTPDQELHTVMEAEGLSLADADTVVLTHMHGDHMDGAVHVRGPVLVHDRDLEFARSFGARVMQRLFRQPVPAGVEFRGFALDGGPFGAFPRSRPLTDDGRVLAVDTAGHTPGHVSILCVADDGKHILLAGDASDTLEQLRARRVDPVAPKPAVSIASMETILAHGQQHPTVYLPSHDAESVTRLREGTTL